MAATTSDWIITMAVDRPDKIVGMTEDVAPIDLVVQGVEAAGWILLGLTIELPL